MRKELQRRHELRNRELSRALRQHVHHLWCPEDIVFLAGDKRVVSDTYVKVGARYLLDPLSYLYTIKAELLITHSFSGGGDTFTVKLDMDTFDVECTYSDSVLDSSVTTVDISEDFKFFFKMFTESQIGIEAKVSDVTNPVDFQGIVLRLHQFRKDTFGDYATIASIVRDLPNDFSEDWLAAFEEETESYEYLSGLKMV